MPTIHIPTFGGEVPRTTPRLLEATQAQKAVNCDLQRGAIEPLKAPSKVASLGGIRRTIFKHDVDGWLSWANEVDVVKSAVIDVDGEAPLGHLFMTGDRSYPTQYFAGGAVYRLGIPRPTKAPKVEVKLGAVATTVSVHGWGADSASRFPPRYGYENTMSPIASDTATVTPISAHNEEPTSTDSGISRTSIYCYTLVQSLADGIWQQESAPSPVSDPIDVLDGDGVTISGFQIPSLPGLTVTHIRIYRTVAGNQSSEFQFLVEIPASQTSYVDTVHNVDLDGDVIQTLEWDPIPDDAKGLIKTDNGIYAAFRGNELLLSEPFIPYAFPIAYRNTVENTIVALGHTDNTIIVLTTGRPYLVTGSDPESMQYTHLPIEQSCVSARSVCMLAGGVIYASPDGLMLFTSKDQELATAQTWTREQWRDLGPESLLGAVHDGKYIGFFEGTNKGFYFVIGARDVVEIELPDGWRVYDVYHHSEDDCVYISVSGNGNAIYQLEASNEDMTFYWHSKPFFTSVLTGMSAARVEADYGSGRKVGVKLYGPNQSKPRQTFTLRDSRVKRITPTRNEKLWSVEVSGTTPVFDICIGGSVEEVVNGQ